MKIKFTNLTGKDHFLLILFLIISIQVAYGQQAVTGFVTDENNEGLPGASVVEKGTSNGTVTDLDGKFSISVPEGSTLVFSYVGYISQEVEVGTNTTFNISMKLDASELEEIVVVGYTTRKRGELTGSISTVDKEQLTKTPNKDLAKSLAGRVPGLIVADRGGLPGATDGIDLLIRGKSTLGNNNPLILIDGVPAANFSFLSPQDIESISVLKDGAAAIYGARAANGVIVITTKRGSKGTPKFNFTSQYTRSTQTAIPDQLSSEQYAIYTNEIAERNGTSLPFTEEDVSNYASGNDPINYPNTAWYDETMADFSPEWRNTLSISGGGDKVSYFLSGDILDMTGLYKSGDLRFEQRQIRSNIDVDLTDFFSLSVDLNGQFGDRTQPGVNQSFLYKHIFVNEPIEVAVYPNGLPGWGGENGANPVVMSSNESGSIDTEDANLRSRLAFELDLNQWVRGLSAQGYVGLRNWSTTTKSWYTPWTVYTFQEGTGEFIPQDGFSQQGNQRILRQTNWEFNERMLNATIRYDRTFDRHTIKGFVGYEQFTSDQSEFFAERRGFPSDDRPELFAGSDEGQISGGGSAEWARLNFFGSLSYDFDKKYFVDFTLRHDGSSNFGDGNRFGTFPGVAVAWSISDEDFMDATIPALSSLKLRASWAIMGNDRIPPFQFLTRYSFGGPTNAVQPNYYIFGTPGTRFNGYSSANVPNPDITWETARMMNLGLNFSLFDYKLTGDINYFYQKREDILITRNASIPDAAGLTLPQENLGKVDNFGWELQLGWNDQIGNLKYNLGFNFTNARNEIVFMDEAVDVPDQLKQEGFPMDSFIMYPTNGIFSDQEEIDAAPAKLDGTVEGEPYYIDTNGDGVISSLDRVRRHTSNIPEIQYGIQGGLAYKGFDFSFLFQGQSNAEMLVFFNDPNRPEYYFDQRWTPNNRGAAIPRAFAAGDAYSTWLSGTIDNPELADLYYYDASFLRLKEVEVGYTLGKDKLKVGSARVFFRGLNLLTMFSDVWDLGLDPEAGSYNGFRSATYTGLKSYSFGLNLNF